MSSHKQRLANWPICGLHTIRLNTSPRGWVNRNRILHPVSGWRYINVPLKKHSHWNSPEEVKHYLDTFRLVEWPKANVWSLP